MDLKAEVAQLDVEIEALRFDIIEKNAHLAGLEAKRASLAAEVDARADREPMASSAGGTSGLAHLDRTEAIVQVLGSAQGAMSIQDVWDGLKTGGRDENDYQVIASTLSLLVKNGRVRRPSRGRYTT